MARLSDGARDRVDARGAVLGNVVQQGCKNHYFLVSPGRRLVLGQGEQRFQHHLRMGPDIALTVIARVLRRGLGQLQSGKCRQAGVVVRHVAGRRRERLQLCRSTPGASRLGT
ncbi:hypothetical protein G6F24_017444 [Rhizopus arrhizus]|nr:hypothetical protein G6F24_017444 [Rhizopus arrhizus]